jgi:hypothetical protein
MATLSLYFSLVQKLRKANEKLVVSGDYIAYYIECKDIFHKAQRMGWSNNMEVPTNEAGSETLQVTVEPSSLRDRLAPLT